VGDYLGVSSHSVHAYVLGEHGDSEVLAWSSAKVGGVALADFARQMGQPLDENVRAQIDDGVRRAAYRIIDGKGATYYGIGAGLARIVEAIRDDEGAVLTLSSLNRNLEGLEGICMSVPRVLGGKGITAELTPTLDQSEEAALKESARILKDAASSLGF
jgi:L-lactate dehydrogenase